MGPPNERKPLFPLIMEIPSVSQEDTKANGANVGSLSIILFCAFSRTVRNSLAVMDGE